MKVQLHGHSGMLIGGEMDGLPCSDFLTWRGRLFRRAVDEQPGDRVQHFHEVGFIAVTSGGHWDKQASRL